MNFSGLTQAGRYWMLTRSRADLDEPMGGWPKPKVEAPAGEPTDLAALLPDTVLSVVPAATVSEALVPHQPATFRWEDDPSSYEPMPDVPGRVVTASSLRPGEDFGTWEIDEAAPVEPPVEAEAPKKRGGWPKGRPRKPAE